MMDRRSRFILCVSLAVYVCVYVHMFLIFFSSQYPLPPSLSLTLCSQVILDACSLERNRVLVASYLVGGASERKLPPHYLTKVGHMTRITMATHTFTTMCIKGDYVM